MAEGFETQGTNIQEISESELKFGYWYVTHKAQLMLVVEVILILFSVATIGYSLYMFVRIYAFEDQAYQAGLQALPVDYVNVAGSHAENQIQDLQVISRDVLTAGSGKIDVVARVRNPNTKWALNAVDYRFGVGSQLYDAKSTFLLPGEEKYLLLLNVDGNAGGTVQILLDNQQWKRVINYAQWGPARLQFTITDKAYLAPSEAQLSDQLPISEAHATILNNTAYNYQNVEVQFALYSGGTLVAVSSEPMPDFASGSTQTIATRWSSTFPTITNVEVIPTVNILDPAVYKDFAGAVNPGSQTPQN